MATRFAGKSSIVQEDAISDKAIKVAVKHKYTSKNFFQALKNAERRGHITNELLTALEEADKKAENGGDQRLHCSHFYMCQSLQSLGEEDDRVNITISIHPDVRNSWYPHLETAIKVINDAAPGLNLHKVDGVGMIRIYGTAENRAYTQGNILLYDYAEIHLYNEWLNKKRTSVHELLHALGFQHEQKRGDADHSVDVKTSDHQYKPSPDIAGITRFDPFSIMLYPENEDFIRKPEDDLVWELKPLNEENCVMSELDKVGLNLIYRPCIGPQYNPQISEETGMWYCGREVMDRHNHPVGSVAVSCGPINSANCHACRTLKNTKVQEIWDSGKWQGWSGLVYCGKNYRKADQGHDGYCGPDIGPSCPECRKLLKPDTAWCRLS